MSVFREIWKESIYCNQQMVLKDDQKGNTVFKSLIHSYPDDGMVYFERGIAFETMGKFGLARLDYEKAKELFPIPHWKNIASFFIERVSLKKDKFNYIIAKNDFLKYKLDILYLVHTYVFITDKIRYLAISSVSRLDSEPEMAIIVFRTCLETALKILNDISIHDKSYDLDVLEKLSFEKGLIPPEYRVDFKNTRMNGNNAAHSNKDFYNDNDLTAILSNFNNCMKVLNDLYKEKAKNPFIN